MKVYSSLHTLIQLASQIYQAYADYMDMLEMLERMLKSVCLEVLQTSTVKASEHEARACCQD